MSKLPDSYFQEFTSMRTSLALQACVSIQKSVNIPRKQVQRRDSPIAENGVQCPLRGFALHSIFIKMLHTSNSLLQRPAASVGRRCQFDQPGVQ